MAKVMESQANKVEGKEMRLQEALREALRHEMAQDRRVFIMGEDVALFGGAYGVTRGLLQDFGEDRVRDTPISEAAMVGLAIGAAINGMRPIVEIQFCDLLPLLMDQLTTLAARYHYMTGGRISVPIVVRNKFGTRAGGGPAILAAITVPLSRSRGSRLFSPQRLQTPRDSSFQRSAIPTRSSSSKAITSTV